MSKEAVLDGAELESVDAVATETKVKKEKKEVTPEEISAMQNAVTVIIESGVSPEMAQMLSLVPNWHDTEGNKAKKDEVAEFFGGADKLKDYVDGPFQEELAAIEAFQAAGSRMKLINSFYKRRENTNKVSKATKTVNIDGTFYIVNKAFYEALEGTKEEKIEALMAHAQTKPFAAEVESL